MRFAATRVNSSVETRAIEERMVILSVIRIYSVSEEVVLVR